MDEASFTALLTGAGQAALQAAQALQPREVDFLTHFQLLCRHYPQELARTALETAILRREAEAKFPPEIASRLYLTRQALEQSTSFQVSHYRADSYHSRFNPSCFLDLGCSIGGDSLALARIAPTTGVDLDMLRLSMARANLASLAAISAPGTLHETAFLQADLTRPLPIWPKPSTTLFFDPGRRTGHRRAFSVRDYQPPLSVIDNWLGDFPALAVKLSPGVDMAELSSTQAEIEFISLNGELKECLLWFGPLRRANRRATLLPSRVQMVLEDDKSLVEPAPRLSPPLAYLFEPDPAVLRAGLVRQLAAELEASQLDPDIAYLTSNAPTSTPFARRWEIEAWFPFQLKRLRQALRMRGVGRVTVKKRGSPLEPQALIRDLRLSGEDERVLVLTHLQGKPVVIICMPPDVSTG